MLAVAGAGLLTGLSLIVAIGAQNAFVLRQGLARSGVGAVVVVCAASDLVLITAGVSGVGAVVDRVSWMLAVVRWLGVAFLAWYGTEALRRVWHKQHLDDAAVSQGPGPESLRRVVGRAVALTWLNPHVYLDTVLLLGSIAATHDVGAGHAGRWWFGAGAALGSVVWFAGLGYGARLLAPVFTRPRAWQVLDAIVGLTMLFVAAKLALM